MSDGVSLASDDDGPADFPRCGNCRWAIERDKKNMVLCGVDLPPHFNVSSEPKRALAHENFVCALYAERDTRSLRKVV
jgi:hypothetical protein